MVFSLRCSRRKYVLVGLTLGLLIGASLTLFGDDYHDNNIFIHGANAILELSAKGNAADIRSWAAGGIGSRGASLFINNINEPGDVDTIINLSRGNVGIGTSDPMMKLDVRGDVQVVGNLAIDGNIRKTGTVNFVQDYPNQPDKEIVYASLEGPEAGTYTRGAASLVDGEAVIQLPDHFELVTANDGLTVVLTPVGEWLQLYVVEQSPEQIIVKEAQGKDGMFNFLVQGIRKGFEDYQVIRER